MRAILGTMAWCGWRQFLPLLAFALQASAAGPTRVPQDAEAPPVQAAAQQGQDTKAASVRAAVLYKLTSYLAWHEPGEGPQKELRIGVLGTDATAAAAAKVLPGKVVGGAVVTVVTIDPAVAAAGRAHEHCDVLYIAASVEDGFVARVVAAHASQAMPTFCERPGFAAQGGSIQLFVEDKNLRFEVNTEALRRQRVRASSQLLKLSRKGPVR